MEVYWGATHGPWEVEGRGTGWLAGLLACFGAGECLGGNESSQEKRCWVLETRESDVYAVVQKGKCLCHGLLQWTFVLFAVTTIGLLC